MIIHKKIIVPDDVDLFFIGDIHGDYKNFKDILNVIDAKDNDYIICTGDLIDRGAGVTPLLFDFIHKPNYHAVIGNHEEMMVHVDQPDNKNLWLYMGNGGDVTLEQLGWEGIKYFTKNILKKFPLILEVHHRGKIFGVTHAGVPLFYENTQHWNDIIKLAKKNTDYQNQLLEDRDLINRIKKTYNMGGIHKEDMMNAFNPIKGVDYIFHGHTGVREPIIYHNMVWIDTMFLTNTFTIAYINKNNMLDFLTNNN